MAACVFLCGKRNLILHETFFCWKGFTEPETDSRKILNLKNKVADMEFLNQSLLFLLRW